MWESSSRGNTKMTKHALLFASAALLTLGTAPAFADCAGEIAMLSSGNQATGAVSGSTSAEPGKISKDGTHAPLETPAGSASAAGESGSTGPAAGTTTNAEGVTTTGDAGGQAATTSSGSGATGTSGAAAGTDTAAAGSVSKDGSTMPLADGQGGGNADVATSDQDAVSQQQGGQTAAAAAGQGTATTGAAANGATSAGAASGSSEMMAALDRARTFQQQGDEASCMQAVEEAKRLQGG
jgi:hypothetical protein